MKLLAGYLLSVLLIVAGGYLIFSNPSSPSEKDDVADVFVTRATRVRGRPVTLLDIPEASFSETVETLTSMTEGDKY